MSKLLLKLLTLLMSLTLLGSAASARAQGAKPAQGEVLTNESVITMTRANLSPNIIVNKIRTSRTSFDLSIAELMRLKRERVADAVIEAMQEGAGEPAAKPYSDSIDRRRPRPATCPRGTSCPTAQTYPKSRASTSPRSATGVAS